MTRAIVQLTSFLRNRQWGRWINRGGWAVLDRALFALTNFALNVTLARWLSPVEYGAFTVANTIFLIIGAAHESMIGEPMMVFGAGRFRQSLPKYFGVLIRVHAALSALIFVALLVGAGVAMAFDATDVGIALLALSVAGPLILALRISRTACYATLQPKLAATAGVLYMALMLGGVYVLFASGLLSVPTALFMVGGTALLAAAFLVVRLGARPRGIGMRDQLMRDAIREHWRYSRWAIGSRMLAATPRHLYFLVLPIWGGLEVTAAFRAMMNLIQPVTELNNALSALLLPALARAHGSKSFKEKFYFAMVLFAGAAISYGTIMAIFHEPIVSLLYAGKYQGYGILILILCFLPLLRAIANVLGSALKAMERPDVVMWGSLSAAIVAVSVGLWAVWVAGVIGAGIGLNLSAAATILTLLWLVFLMRRRIRSSQA